MQPVWPGNSVGQQAVWRPARLGCFSPTPVPGARPDGTAHGLCPRNGCRIVSAAPQRGGRRHARWPPSQSWPGACGRAPYQARVPATGGTGGLDHGVGHRATMGRRPPAVGEPLRRPRPAPPAGGEQAGEARLLLESLPLARRSPYPPRPQGEGRLPLPDVVPGHTTADSQASSRRCCSCPARPRR